MGERVQSKAPVQPPSTATHAVRPSITPVRAALLQRACACGQLPGTGGKCDDCDKKEKGKTLQRASNGAVAPATIPPIVNQVLSSPGRPLDTPTRTFMESRFGQDFGGVRIHNDSAAAESARAVNAKAYTVGNDIVFDHGNYNPGTHSGNHLLAHELAHTIQQGGVHRYANDLRMGGAMESHLEREADSVAHAVTQSSSPASTVAPHGMSRSTGPIISRVPSITDPNIISTLKKEGFEEMDAAPTGVAGIRRFRVLEDFPLPGSKGAAAKDVWDKRALAGGLEAVLDTANDAKSVLKQERPSTDWLRQTWLSKVQWSEADAPQKWKAAGGDKASFNPPEAGGATCQMDHIIELQVGGTNVKENIQALDRSPNASSGATIRGYLSGKGTKLRDAIPQVKLQDVILHWDKVAPSGPLVNDPCYKVETAATATLPKPGQTSEGIKAEPYPINAGGTSTEILITDEFKDVKKAVPIKASQLAENQSASTIISGLALIDLHRNTPTHTIKAEIDTSPKSRLPGVMAAQGRGTTVNLNVDKTGKLTLPQKATAINFVYPYLSPGTIKQIALDETGGISGSGTIKPTVGFLGELGFTFSKDSFAISKGLGESSIKGKKFLGITITAAPEIKLELAPAFRPSGRVEFAIGSVTKPLATGFIELSADDTGVVGVGKIKANIPKMSTAESEVTYKGGGGRNEWSVDLHIKSEDIALGPGISATGQFDGRFDKTGLNFTGKIKATFPGNNEAELALKKSGNYWLVAGGGTFHVPKLDKAIHVLVTYNLTTDHITAEAKDIQFTIFGLTATLLTITGEFKPGQEPLFYGEGQVTLKKGKLDGSAKLKLNKNKKFTGTGTVKYQFTENLIASATVELDDQERLKFTGEITIAQIKLFDAFGDTKELFSVDISIPIPGASIGGIGLEARIGGGVTVGYNVGPGTIAPLKFAAGFYPLEEQTDLTVGVSGSLNIPASAFLEANIHADIVLDAFIAEVGGGVKLTGTIKLKGGLFVPFSATFKQGAIEGEMTPELKFALMLGLALSIRAWAKAGIGWLSVKTEKEWTVAKREIDTGLGFSLSAPIKFSTKTGPQLPSMKDVTFKPPEVSTEKMKSILSQLVSGSSPTEKEA